MSKKVLLAGLATIAIAVGGSALASDHYIRMVSNVDQVCEIDLDGFVYLTYTIDVSKDNFIQAGANIDCNVPYAMSVQASNGGFRSDKAGLPGYTGGTDEVEYTLDVSTDAGDNSFNSNDLTTSQALLSSGTPSFGDDGYITVSWDAGSNLYAGTYEDTVTFTITPTP